VSYPSIIEASAAVPVPVRLTWDQDFQVTQEILEKHYSHKTKMLIINYPNNPTGRCLSIVEALEIQAFMEAHPDVLLLTDEIYERILYTGKENVSMASFPKIADRVLTVNGFSKSHAMTGWRMGYVCGPKEIISQMLKIHQYAIMSAPTTSQYAAIEAMREGDRDVAMMQRDYDYRRRYLLDGLRNIGIDCFEPRGAFYMFPSIKSTGLTSEEFCERFLMEEKVAVIPGTAFGLGGEGFIRMSYASSIDNLTEALVRMKRFVSKL